MKIWLRRVAILALCASCLLMTGCDGNVGVGMSVSVPVGSNGRVHVGGSRWY